MEINSAVIDAYQKIVTDPTAYGFNFISIVNFFEKSETVTPKHLLAKSYIDYMETQNKPLNKLVVYIIMDNVFGLCNGKATNGDLGYNLTPKQNAS